MTDPVLHLAIYRYLSIRNVAVAESVLVSRFKAWHWGDIAAVLSSAISDGHVTMTHRRNSGADYAITDAGRERYAEMSAQAREASA